MSYVDGLGLLPIDVRSKNPPFWKKWLKVSFGRVKKDHLVFFSRQLSTLIKAGVPILMALESLIEQTEQPVLSRALETIRYDVESGKNFSEALRAHPDVFPSLYVNTIVAGETGGVLPKVLDRLTEILDHEYETESNIKAALRYPMFVLLALVGAFLFLVTVVVPQFISMFARLGGELPWMTKVLIQINALIRDHWVVMIIAVISMIFAAKMFLSTRRGQRTFDYAKMKIPVIGPLLLKLYISRFSHMLGMLLDSGMPILRALGNVAPSVGNVIIEEEINKIESSVREGEGFAGPLKESPYFPPMVSYMARVGEASGQISEMLLEIARHYDRDIKYTVAHLTKLIEPLVITLLAAMVLFFALGIFLPMWDYYNLLVRG